MREGDDRPASDGLVAVVGMLMGVLAVLATSTIADVLRGEPVAVAAATLERVPARLRHLADAATVGLEAHGCAGDERGTGVITRGGLVLTAAHVTAGARRAAVTTGDGVTRVQAPVMTATGADVASLPAPSGAAGVAQSRDDAAVGDEVVVASRGPSGLRVRAAHVDARLAGGGAADPPVALRLDVAVVPGDSGGPVLDVRGRLVGVVYAAERNSGRALVIPVSELARALGGPQTRGAC